MYKRQKYIQPQLPLGIFEASLVYVPRHIQNEMHTHLSVNKILLPAVILSCALGKSCMPIQLEVSMPIPVSYTHLDVYKRQIMLILAAACVFFVSPILGFKLGIYGTLLNEILLLVLAVGLTAVVRGDFKQVFPIRKPRLSAIFGTILLWIGSFLAIMIITMIIAYF